MGSRLHPPESLHRLAGAAGTLGNFLGPLLARAALFVVATVTALAVVALTGPESRRVEPGSARSIDGGNEWPEHQNLTADYSFEYPSGWFVEDEGTASKVLHPQEMAVVTFGTDATDDGVLEIAERMTQRISGDYDAVKLGTPRVRSIGGRIAVVRKGTVKTADGTPLLFHGAAIEGAHGNYIAIGFVRDGDRAEKLASLVKKSILTFDVGG